MEPVFHAHYLEYPNMNSTHVFLGPTLDLMTAQSHLWQAHYHPPIQCGDLVRLLRLAPKRIILIDGLYEQVPAVWHKEIMLAIDSGIKVYGAASMGALRAAELHAYGMIGIGKIFQAYASQQLTDDDEVAVIHYGYKDGLLPINDAMVNIRETLEHAHRDGIIDSNTMQSLITLFKAKFYPNRALVKELKQMKSTNAEDYSKLLVWIEQHGFIDLKRMDAIQALQYVQADILADYTKKHQESLSKNVYKLPYTKFIASLVDEMDSTPFPVDEEWLPEIEKKILFLRYHKPYQYRIVSELAQFLKLSTRVIDPSILLEDHQHYLLYIEQNSLYFPNQLYQYLQHHPVLQTLYPWMLHYTCLSNITYKRIKTYLPAIRFYFESDAALGCFDQHEEVLSWILMFVFLLNQQLEDDRLKIKRNILSEHLEDIQFWQRYNRHKEICEKSAIPVINLKAILDFVTIYMKIIYIHQGFRDIKVGSAKTPDYFNWIYDAWTIASSITAEANLCFEYE